MDKYLPNGITGAYSYNPNGDINAIAYTSGANNVLNLNYSSYDNAHNILTQGKNGVTRTFSYDNVNQLTGVNVGGVQTEQFTYDPVGNRLTSIDNPTWTYNTDNELTGFGATTMTYDPNGNMTADSSAGSTLTYDFENRLASFVTSSVTANYLYDPQGRRLQKTVNSVVTRYLWDGATMIAELDGTNQITRLYTYNPQSMEPVSTAIGCTAYFYITDHLMTPQMLTSISGTTVWYAELSAFGTANVITSTVTNNLRFPGQYADAESGLYYNYARYYRPEAGRYLQEDPIWQIIMRLRAQGISEIQVQLLFSAAHPQLLQEYIYALNNPFNWIDPLGLFGEWNGVPYPPSYPYSPINPGNSTGYYKPDYPNPCPGGGTCIESGKPEPNISPYPNQVCDFSGVCVPWTPPKPLSPGGHELICELLCPAVPLCGLPAGPIGDVAEAGCSIYCFLSSPETAGGNQ